MNKNLAALEVKEFNHMEPHYPIAKIVSIIENRRTNWDNFTTAYPEAAEKILNALDGPYQGKVSAEYAVSEIRQDFVLADDTNCEPEGHGERFNYCECEGALKTAAFEVALRHAERL